MNELNNPLDNQSVEPKVASNQQPIVPNTASVQQPVVPNTASVQQPVMSDVATNQSVIEPISTQNNEKDSTKKLKKETDIISITISTLVSIFILSLGVQFFIVPLITSLLEKIVIGSPVISYITASAIITLLIILILFLSVKDQFRKKYLNKKNCKAYFIVMTIIIVIRFGYNIYSLRGVFPLMNIINIVSALVGSVLSVLICKKIIYSRNEFAIENDK